MSLSLQYKLSTLSETLSLAGQRLEARKRAARRVGYIGGQGDANLGDEVMLEAARRLLPGKQLLAVGFPRQETRLAKGGLSGRGYFESILLGGGTLINDYVWKDRVQTALAQGVPVATLGTGVGSCGFGHSEAIDLAEWKPMLADFKGVGVRGPLSQAALCAAGIENAEVIGDLALSLSRDQAATPSEVPCFALNTTLPPAHSRDTGDYSALAELEPLVCELLRKGWQPVPVAMHRADVEPLQRLLHKAGLENRSVDVIPDAETFFQRVAPCHFTVAVRLHTAVLSCCVGVPPLMLGYRAKCLDFMQSMQMSEWHLSIEKVKRGEISEKTMELARTAEQMRPVVLERACSWKRKIIAYTQQRL
jgi:polysaccharide pyruvyl transferase WcaK-like protein